MQRGKERKRTVHVLLVGKYTYEEQKETAMSLLSSAADCHKPCKPGESLQGHQNNKF